MSTRTAYPARPRRGALRSPLAATPHSPLTAIRPRAEPDRAAAHAAVPDPRSVALDEFDEYLDRGGEQAERLWARGRASPLHFRQPKPSSPQRERCEVTHPRDPAEVGGTEPGSGGSTSYEGTMGVTGAQRKIESPLPAQQPATVIQDQSAVHPGAGRCGSLVPGSSAVIQ